VNNGADLNDFFENSAFALHIVGNDGTILHANRAEMELLGYSAHEYIGQRVSDFHADRLAIEDILARLARGETIRCYPATLRAKDGSLRYVQITSSANFRDGVFQSTRCLTVDVTEAKLAEEREKEGQQRWRAAIDAIPAALYITDADGRITYYNEAAVEMSGRRPELGADSWCVTWRLFNLDGSPLPHDECPMAVALKEDRPVRGVEAIAERPDGRRVRFQPFPTPLHDEHGRLLGAINLLMDVTEIRQTEADVARLAAIVTSSSDAIISKTLAGVVTSWNEAAAAMYGYDASEMIGQSITRLIPPELLNEEEQILAKVRTGEKLQHYETERVRKDGARISVSLSISPIKDKSGKLLGAAKVARDISQRKEAEVTKQLLLGELNHRVKNTLATVQAIASQTLRKSKSPAEFVPSFTGRIQALASAHSLLTQSDWQGAELGALVRSQVISDENDRIVCSGPEIMLPAQLSLHLALMLHELGTNARKHGALSAPKGEVTVEWSASTRAPAFLQLLWSETGGPPMYVESTPKPGFGTALIARSMQSIPGAEARMRVESHGIVWTLRIPLPGSLPELSQASDRPNSIIRSVTASEPQTKARRILIVEDEPLLAMDMTASLEEAGFHIVGPAAQVDEAMRFIAQADFDVAFLDGNLGGDPVDQLAAALTRRNIPFAFITGYGRENLPSAFAAAPMLTKPVDGSAMVRLASKLLAGSNDATPMRREGSA
jgi:PAS domain S-box-containing protein